MLQKSVQQSFHSEHPLSALSHGNMSVISSFHGMGVGDAFSDCFVGEHTR